jgi:hypothetical protein
MRLLERLEDGGESILGHDGLDAKLGDALLATRLAEGRIRRLAAAERASPRRVPRAALVVADAAGSGLEDGVAGGLERLARNEPDELEAAQRLPPG